MDLRSKPQSPMGVPLVSLKPPEGSRLDIISPNWCDRTTWFESSIEVVDEVLTDSGDHMTYSPALERPWIDVNHFKITGERALRAKYSVEVKVNDVAKTEDPPGGFTNDYHVNYATGQVVFNVALDPADVVKATYYYENGSLWTIKPEAGKCLRVTEVEVQFSENVQILDAVIFQAYGLVEAFAPQLLDTAEPPGPYPAGTKIPLGDPTVYQCMMDYINEASLAYPQIPQMGGATSHPRAMKGPVQIFRWPYAERAATDLHGSKGMEIRISLEANTALGGDVAVATFFGLSEGEG